MFTEPGPRIHKRKHVCTLALEARDSTDLWHEEAVQQMLGEEEGSRLVIAG